MREFGFIATLMTQFSHSPLKLNHSAVQQMSSDRISLSLNPTCGFHFSHFGLCSVCSCHMSYIHTADQGPPAHQRKRMSSFFGISRHTCPEQKCTVWGLMSVQVTVYFEKSDRLVTIYSEGNNVDQSATLVQSYQ